MIAQTASLLLGVALSLYATVVFERRKRFRELLREIAQTRVATAWYPISPHDLERVHPHAVDFWQFLDRTRWELDAMGHHAATEQLSRLSSFIAGAAACIERMLAAQRRGESVDPYFCAFQEEHRRASEEFIRFEATVSPSRAALLRPMPAPLLPQTRGSASASYFQHLL